MNLYRIHNFNINIILSYNNTYTNLISLKIGYNTYKLKYPISLLLITLVNYLTNNLAIQNTIIAVNYYNTSNICSITLTPFLFEQLAIG